MSNQTDTKENMDDYNTDDKDYYGTRILPRSHWDIRGAAVETKQTPAAYDPNEFLPAGILLMAPPSEPHSPRVGTTLGSIPDAAGQVNLNAKFQKERHDEEEIMRHDARISKEEKEFLDQELRDIISAAK